MGQYQVILKNSYLSLIFRLISEKSKENLVRFNETLVQVYIHLDLEANESHIVSL